MTNILLTNKCVRECPYCFAGEEMARSSRKDYMAWENVIYLADFLQASAEKHVSLLGGEPTLHPEFVDILLYFIERGFGVTVFTSGIMSKAKLDELTEHAADFPADRLAFVCNLNDPEQTKTRKPEAEKLDAFLSALGRYTMPGFNIYRPDFRLEFLFDVISRYGLKKRLRLGLTHPIPGAANAFIPVEGIGAIVDRLYSYRNAFDSQRVKPNFDCGFPLCRVSDEQLGWLARLSGHANFKCSPAIDITPEMEVYHCFPLSAFARKSVFEFDSFKQLVDHYKALEDRFRSENPGIYAECKTCVHRADGACAGGGMCQVLYRAGGDLTGVFAQ